MNKNYKFWIIICLCVFTVSFCLGVIPGNIALKSQVAAEKQFSNWIIETQLNEDYVYWRKMYDWKNK